MEPSPGPKNEPSDTVANPFPIVGIGASAGGLAAFEAFFSGLPPERDTGMAFVLVQHLSPDHKSMLSEIIQRSTRMEVFEVEDGMPVRPNHVYIIPPNRDMALMNGSLQLFEPGAPRGQRLPIDFFFRSLADDQHALAIGIVMSGTGSDGSLGVRAIKGAGGLILVQQPETAEFDGMPLSAIATGMADYLAAPAEMPEKLLAYLTHGGVLHTRPSIPSPKSESALKKIFVLLRNKTAHDFSQYKPSTIERRIERRMAINLIPDFDDYVKLLMRTPDEVDALFRDLLIGVTQFFRDKESFAALESQVIPKLFEDHVPGTPIRIWVAGCSTGEEAYSIAILLQERLDLLKQGLPIQVFATDIDDRAVNIARQGRYPANIAADVSPERLARFFTLEPGGGEYRIHKNIRDMLIFSEQDLIKDPPFSKLDLISCRNLLIYLDADLQKKVIPLFNFALKAGGFLFLGNSEGVGEFEDLFAAVDRKAKIFRRKESYQGLPLLPAGRFQIAMPSPASAPQPMPGKAVHGHSPNLRELTERVLLQVAPAAALIDAKGDIFYLHGRTGPYLEPAPGASGVNNILKMAREGLQHSLATALRKAADSKEIVKTPGLMVKTNGHFSRVNLTVSPVPMGVSPAADASLFIVILQEAATDGEAREAPLAEAPLADSTSDARLEALRLELRFKDDMLQSAKEELESSGEELKSSNEEMQSINEELQSANEELETSKEELQSVNEELATVNAELQNRLTALSRLNNDMANLLAGTGIATIFINHQMRILRFTPAATEIINLIPGDIGRPVAHIVSNLIGYVSLIPDIQEVLRTLAPINRDVQLQDGRWFSMRIKPYRTLDNVIEGAVISFMDISDRKLVTEEFRRVNELVHTVFSTGDAQGALVVNDMAGRIVSWNHGAERLYGWTGDEALRMADGDRIPIGDRKEAKSQSRALEDGTYKKSYLANRLGKSGSILQVMVTQTPLKDEAGKIYAIASLERIPNTGDIA